MGQVVQTVKPGLAARATTPRAAGPVFRRPTNPRITNPNARLGGGPAMPADQPHILDQYPLTQTPPNPQTPAQGSIPGFVPSWKMAGYNSLDEWKAATGGINPLAQRGFGPPPPGANPNAPDMTGSLFESPFVPTMPSPGIPSFVPSWQQAGYNSLEDWQAAMGGQNPNASIGFGPAPLSNIGNTMGTSSPMMNTVGYFGFRP